MKYNYDNLVSDVLPDLFYIKRKKLYLKPTQFGSKALTKISTETDESYSILYTHPNNLFVFYFNVKDSTLFGLFEPMDYKYEDIDDDFYRILIKYNVKIVPPPSSKFDMPALIRRITIESIVNE